MTEAIRNTYDEAVKRVREVDGLLADHNARGPRTQVWFDRRRELLERKNKALAALREAKSMLQEVNGTRGGDPKWILLAKASVLLERLEDEGVEIGKAGEKLIEDIAFHVSPAMRVQAQEEMKDGN